MEDGLELQAADGRRRGLVQFVTTTTTTTTTTTAASIIAHDHNIIFGEARRMKDDVKN